ncbi:2-oxo-4-hydroxy-4-carboxy-5-ureidoimidazoline decarboxylase [Hoyosella altamirensis]|uniref:2-oxo-4-hydroxy-4-carboxy-5-ureidoimidazoline decarboxylase n=1 Tax=Hoyosella altamirensis TaxID=616997 RepID=A0A839RUF7_9ACTN|nr:2-oxo-4-hydroxy-4-carboxy-5-ureidoimidazoline decarboxylase [Hoyosella altamirensis]MBB3039441.1 2-oxo-4-hydroxy-4-carboxy-5-ureidoimidazoline decarboxylase [Hoyosella altamirensis]
MTIAHFNALSAERAAAMISRCASIPRWVDTIVARRPFPSVDRLLEFAERASMCWTPDEVAAALAKHPQISERVASMTGRADGSVAGTGPQSPAAQSHELRTLAMHRMEWLFGT